MLAAFSSILRLKGNGGITEKQKMLGVRRDVPAHSYGNANNLGDTSTVDDRAVELIRELIQSMPASDQ